MKKLSIVILTLILVSVLLIIYKYYTAPILVIDRPTLLLEEPEFAKYTKVLVVLNAGERGKILWVTYSKDAKYYKVRMENGDMGYVEGYYGIIVIDGNDRPVEI